MNKICPLLKEDCKKEKCGWWSELGDCSIPLIADSIDSQAGTVRDILNHM